MAKVYGIHMIALRPGADAAAFERFAVSGRALPIYAGWHVHLLKADRGDGVGRYVVLFEFDSVAARDRYTGADSVIPVEEVQRFQESLTPEMRTQMETYWETWKTFTPHVPGETTIYTDYIEIA